MGHTNDPAKIGLGFWKISPGSKKVDDKGPNARAKKETEL